MNMKRTKMFLLLVAMLFAVTLTACGGGSGSGGDSGGDSGSSGPAVSKVEIQQTGLVLTEAGATKQLSASAYDDQGNTVVAPISWTSTTPADIAVDSSGKVTAKTANGSSQIIAEANGVKSAPLLAVVTELPASAIALNDSQIAGDPVETDPNAEPSFDNTYKVVLTGIAAPNVDDLLINTESKPVAGRVVDVDTTGGNITVELRLVSLREMFPKLNIKETLDLSQAPVTVNPELAADYDIQHSGDTYTFTPKAGLSSLAAPLLETVLKPAAAPPGMGPFSECETTLPSFPLQLSVPPVFSIQRNLSLDMVYTSANGLERFVIVGGIKPKVEVGLTVTAVFEVKAECTAELFTIRIPVGGALSFFVAGLVPIKAGFEAGGKVTIANASLGVKAQSELTTRVGVECPSGANCGIVADLTAKAEATPKANLPNISVRFEPSLEAFGKAELAIGNPFLKSLRFDAFYAKAGPKLEGSFASWENQIVDASYNSDYKVSLEGKAGIGRKLNDAMKLLGLGSVNLFEFVVSVDIAKSPTGAIHADRVMFIAGEQVNFSVSLNAGTVNFYPGLGPYNVSQIVLVRNSNGAVAEAGRVAAASGQTEFLIPYTATSSGQTSEFTAFLVTTLLPLDFFSLEIGMGEYSLIDLGTLGGPMSMGMGINENGQVVGASQIGLYMYAFLWDNGTMTNLGALGGQGSWAYDINDAGQVVGGSPLSNGDNHTFLWQNGAMQDMGTLGGPSSYAFEINNSGQAVGYACCAPDTYLSHAVLWGSGGIVDLGDLDQQWPAISAAYGINDAGQVVGGSYDASANFHAFLWQNGSMQDLGTLGGDYSSAEAINENGQVVGTARLANSTPHAFLWQNGAMQDLGALTWDQSIAYDINDSGQVVGALQTGQNSHAFLWGNGQMHDLNNLIPTNSGWVLSEARAINNKGQIVGFGTINGQTHGFLLSPP